MCAGLILGKEVVELLSVLLLPPEDVFVVC